MRVLVTGTRHPKDFESARAAIAEEFGVVDRLSPGGGHTLIHGNARGIDKGAEAVAIESGLFKGIYRFPAEWERLGRSAGMARNEEMVETLRPDIVLAFPGPDSVGTWGCVRLFEGLDGMDVPVIIHKVE